MGRKMNSNINLFSLKLKKAISILLATTLLVGLAGSMGVTGQETAQEFAGLSAGQTVNVYRLFNPEMRYHFYTNDATERDSLIHRNWGNFEGIAFVGDTSDTIPVYRLFSPILRVHHYTTDKVEWNHLLASGAWNDEGVVFHSAEVGIPVYRLFHPELMRHLFTSDAHERGVLLGRGWNDEGIAWYARTLGQPIPNFLFSRDLGGGRFEVGIENPTKPAGSEIVFATWSERSNQEDVVWRRGTAYGNRWTVIVSAWEHRYWGTFVTHVHARMADETHAILGQITFQVPESAMRVPVPHWSLGSMPHNPGGRPISEVLGFDRQQWMNRLEYHEHTNFYLGTPFRGFNARNPNGNPHFSPPIGVPGMNCTGFVWHTILALGVPGNQIPNMEMTVPQTGPGWGRWIRENNLRTYNFYSVYDMGRSGILERGDIIWSWATTPGQLSDWHHVGIYWGNGRYWHSCPLVGRNAITPTIYGLTGQSLWTVVKMN